MALTVLSVAYPLAPVRPETSGGAEQVLATIDEGLAAAGHRSIVVADATSVVRGALCPSPSHEGPLTSAARARAQAAHRAVVRDALERFSPDLVHLHGVDFAAYLPDGAVPLLVTLHLPIPWYDEETLANAAREWGVHFNGVSEWQWRRWLPERPLSEAIPNGIPLRSYAPAPHKASFCVTLGRICPEKGIHRALDASRRAGAGHVVAGRTFRYPEHERYFREEVRPRLSGRRVFVGEVGPADKARLLSRARCLLLGGEVEEPSSLVAMEALASGTPVIAFRSGAIVDIVDEGRTGFLVGDEQEMAEAIAAAGSLDPGACRRAAEERFDGARMVERYLALYERLARGRADEALAGGSSRAHPSL